MFASFNVHRPHKIDSIINKTKILIVSEARSGSTFLGDLVQHMRPIETYYSFEPLIALPIDGYTDLLADLFACRFESIEATSTHLEPIFWKIQYFRRNERLRMTVEQDQRDVFDTEEKRNLAWFNASLHQSLCEQAKVLVAKTIRLSLGQWIPNTMSVGPAKVVYLVRDPRAVMSSRLKLPWCYDTPNCTDHRALCAKMTANLDLLEKLDRPCSTVLVRYEDMIANISTLTNHLAHFLGLGPLTSSFHRWLTEHTERDDVLGDPHSTYRDVSRLATSSTWHQELAPEAVREIEAVCGDVMARLGYEKWTKGDVGSQTRKRSRKHKTFVSSSYPLRQFSVLRTG